MSSIVPPAPSTAAFTFSSTWRVCAVMSPTPAMLPSSWRAVMPEMKTRRPVASIMVACENTPFGWRNFGLLIWTLGMWRFLMLFVWLRVEKRSRNAEVRGEAPQHRNHRRFEPDHAGGRLAAAPFGLARREQLRDAGRTRAAAHPLGRSCRLRTERAEVAEMRDVDRDEEMRAVVRHGKVAIERAHRGAERALRQQPAHHVDQEREAKALRPAGRQQHAGDRLPGARGRLAARRHRPGRRDWA